MHKTKEEKKRGISKGLQKIKEKKNTDKHNE